MARPATAGLLLAEIAARPDHRTIRRAMASRCRGGLATNQEANGGADNKTDHRPPNHHEPRWGRAAWGSVPPGMRKDVTLFNRRVHRIHNVFSGATNSVCAASECQNAQKHGCQGCKTRKFHLRCLPRVRQTRALGIEDTPIVACGKKARRSAGRPSYFSWEPSLGRSVGPPVKPQGERL
jgi:hypothetical protein